METESADRMEPQATGVVERTKSWISTIVIGLNLCPFADRVFSGNRIRYVVSEALDRKTLLADLDSELKLLNTVPTEEVETTLLIHPGVLQDFLDYNEFLGDAENLIEQRKLSGVIQLATFHPAYQFAGTKPDAVENYTNRSPYPMLHLLREASITAIANNPDELLAIPDRNIQTLRALGRKEMVKRLNRIRSAH